MSDKNEKKILVSLKNISYLYNEGQENQIKAINNVSLDFYEGEFVALVGHNGSGKSTIAKLMNGLLLPSTGVVEVDGLDTSDKDNLFNIRKTVGVVFQNPDNQIIATIIEDDIAFGPENLGLKPEDIDKRVDWALDAVGMKEHRKGTPFRLSGGQKQRIAIAGVLAISPRLLVLDESTAMLDPNGREEVLKVVTELNKKHGVSVVMITHFMEEAVFADRIIVMNNGEVFSQGGREVFDKVEELKAIGLDVPMPLRIIKELSKHGIDVGSDAFTIGELVEKLCQ